MRISFPRLCVFAACFLLLTISARADDWKTDPVWHDGLVEKAVYSASRVVYGKPRPYTAIFFTNKEQHDKRTLTKADKSKETIEVWKHNQVEDIPTPNYTYHYVTTSHLTANDLQLTRLDCSSQEFCGTSFKQYLAKPLERGSERGTGALFSSERGPERGTGALFSSWDYWSFSYMPEAGRKSVSVSKGELPVVAEDSLPLYLRQYAFQTGLKLGVSLLLSQKSNRPTSPEPFAATIQYSGEEAGAHKLELMVDDKPRATFWMAKDRLHVMLKYTGPQGQICELKELSRVNYWTIKE